MQNEQSSFSATISDGYSFRNIVFIIRNEIEEINMIINPRHIEIIFMNSSKSASHQIIINGDDLIEYIYNIKKPFHVLRFKTSDIFFATKDIGRKDGFRINWSSNSNDVDIIAIRSNTSCGLVNDCNTVGLLAPRDSLYNILYKHDPLPNVRVFPKRFSDICLRIISKKYYSLKIKGFPDKIELYGVAADGSEKLMGREKSKVLFGNSDPDTYPNDTSSDYENDDSEQPDNEIINNDDTLNKQDDNDDNDNIYDNDNNDDNDDNDEEQNTNIKQQYTEEHNVIDEIVIPLKTVKSLSRIHNICPSNNCLMKFYFKDENPIKIEIRFLYGKYKIFLNKCPNS